METSYVWLAMSIAWHAIQVKDGRFEPIVTLGAKAAASRYVGKPAELGAVALSQRLRDAIDELVEGDGAWGSPMRAL